MATTFAGKLKVGGANLPEVSGSGKVAGTAPNWIGLSAFAVVLRQAAKQVIVFLAIALLLVLALRAETFTPLGYWQFGVADPYADSSGNSPVHPVTINPSAVHVGVASPIVGNYYQGVDLPNTRPGVEFTLDDSSANLEVGIEFWFRARQGLRMGSVDWTGKCQLYIGDLRVEWYVLTANGGDTLIVDLRGIGAADPYHLLDQNWHHIVALYSAKTGEQRLYIDGICPPGFFAHQPLGSFVRDGGDLYFTYQGAVDHLVADIDEFAAYDTVIPPQLVWEHYQAGLAGDHYDFTVQSSVATYPFPDPVQEGEFNLMDFAPGYPNVALSPLNLFDTYPLPRYSFNDSIRLLVPWMADDPPFLYNADPIQSNVEARAIHERLALEWNYYLFGGGAQMGYNYVTLTPGNQSKYMFHAFPSMNANPNLPRFMISNWSHVNQQNLIPTHPPGNAILGQTMSPNFYIRDWAGVPALDGFGKRRKNLSMAANPADPRLDSIDLDGLTNRMYFLTTMQQVTNKHVEMLGENDEAIGVMDPAYVNQDVDVWNDFTTNFPGQPSKEYQSERVNYMRTRYRDQWLNYLDTMNAAASMPPADLMWYDLAGDVGYQRQRHIARFADGNRRASLHIYPQDVRFWRHGYSAAFGMDQACTALRFQIQMGDSLFSPAVSPGFTDGGDFWSTSDSNMLRPGQFLGLLKGLGCMGADAYAIFMVQAGSSQFSDGNWRTWQMPMLSYAQGITSRVQQYMYNGSVLTGDTTLTYFGSSPTYYTFSTGNANDLITGRRLPGQQRYLVSASAQRTSNQQSQAPKAKVVSFRFHDNAGFAPFDTLRIEERLQGSTYIIDRSNVAAPIFYQLDKWHEWKEPGHWCRDFDFEAEVWDSALAGVSRVTERPVPANSGNFTKYVTFTRHSSPSGWVEYHFRPTGADQDTLYVWLHARSTTGQQSVPVSIDGNALPPIAVVGGTAFGWHGRTSALVPVSYGPLSPSDHVLRVQVGAKVDLDRILLLRGNQPDTALWLSNALILPTSDTQVCFGDSAYFHAKLGAAPGCYDHVWEFGDGTTSNGGTAASAANVGMASINDDLGHLYQYPGIYTVVLSVTNSTLGETVRDTLLVHVRAPFVDAGPDHVACVGDSVQLLGDAQPVYHWLPDTTLASTTILYPLALADTSHYYYLHSLDTAGCAMTDSAWVRVIDLPGIPQQDTVYICPGDSARLVVNGAAWVEWTPDSTLSDWHLPATWAFPAQTTTYFYTAIDICRCDTILRPVTVVVQGTTTADTTICLGGTAVLHAVGVGPFVWYPDTVTTITDLLVSPIVSTAYFLDIDSTLACNEVRVTVLPFACCSIPVPTDWVRVHLLSAAYNGGTYRVFDTLFVDNSVSFNGTTFLMQPYAVISVAPGVTLTTSNCTFKADCPVMWSGIRMRAASSRWNSTSDNLYSAIRGVWSTGGAALNLYSTTFADCWTGVFVEGGSATNFRRIEGCKFLDGNSFANLLSPFANQARPWAGVHLLGVTGFVVGVPTPGVLNRFEQLQHGVYCRNAQVQVYNNKFMNMFAGAVQATLPPWNSNQYGLGNGSGVRSVVPLGLASAYSVTVGHATSPVPSVLAQHANIFSSNRHGLYAQGPQAIKVRGNSLNLNRVGVNVVGSNNSQVLIDRNTHSRDSLGIFVGSSNGTTGRIADNTLTSVNGIYHGIRLDGMNYAPNPAAGYAFEVLRCTTNLRGNGIWVNHCSRINVQENNLTLAPLSGDVMRGITVTAATGNRVNLNQVRTNTVGLNSPNIAGIYVFGSGRSMVTCNTTFAMGRHVVFEGSCPNSDFKGNIMQSATGSLTAPAGVSGLVLLNYGFIGPQGTATAPTDNQWKGIFTTGQTAVLTANVQSTIRARSGSTFTPTFNYASFGLPIQILSASGSGINCGIISIASSKLAAIQDAASATTPITALDSAMKYRTDEWAYEAMLEDSALLANNPSIQPYFNALKLTNLGAASRANVKLTVPDTVLAIIESAQVNPVTTILGNQKIVQGVRLDDGEIDSLELSRLLAIAGQCEDLGGKGVNIARAMLAAEGIFIWEDPACGGSPPPVKKQDEAANSIIRGLTAECWPNPSTGHMFVRFSAAEVKGRLNVIDATGRILHSRAFEYGGQPLEIDASVWAQGLLLVQVELKDGTLFNWRIVLER